MNRLIASLIFLLIALQSNAQTNYYEENWKEVQQLMQKQKVQDAEKQVRNILAFAKKNDNKANIIKTIAYLRINLASRDEKNQVNNILAFEKELPNLNFPEKNIVHSMIATMYNTYYRNNRWKIYKRTNVSDPNNLKYPKDVETWTPQIYFNKIAEHYDASLKKSTQLKKIRNQALSTLITKGKNTEKLQPTLFDVLVHRAIDFYSYNETDIAKPAFFFELKNSNVFAPSSVFAQTVFINKDQYSSKYKALYYLQQATKLHLNDIDPLLDLDCKRLQFAKMQYKGTDGDRLYELALKALINKNTAVVSKPKLLLAQHYQSNNKINAIKYCNDIIENHPKSIEYNSAVQIKRGILKPSLSIQTENAETPNKNILAKLSYKNINELYLKVIQIDYTEYKKRLYDYRANKRVPVKGETIKNWSLDLSKQKLSPKEKLENQSTEIKIDPLAQGYYAIVASADKSFNEKKAPVSFALLHSTHLSFVNNVQNDNTLLFILDRASGQPLAEATVHRYRRKYNYKKRKYETIKIDTRTTNKNGQIEYKSKGSNSNYSLEIEHLGDIYWSTNGQYNRRNYTPHDKKQLYLFTDRAIYRPGQNIFFKGIYISSQGDGKKHNVLANQKITIELRNANRKSVKKLSLTTNEFGSINGSFKAPEGLLNGRFSLYSSAGQKSIRVEEYKRPTFEVKLKKLDKNVKLNDEIRIKGEAKSYAGSAISNAKVKYTVRRKVRFPYYWCYYYYGGGSSSNEIVLSTGETTSDANGNFNIDFKAIGDNKINPRTRPFYSFEVNADVIDINGETRTGNKAYTLSDRSLILSVEMPTQRDFNAFNSIKVSTTNISGSFTPSAVQLKFYLLEAPVTPLKNRYWSAPKKNILDSSTFKNYFPDYAYNKEANPLFWKKGKQLWTKSITTKENSRTYLQKIAPNDGYYLLVATAKDKEGKKVEEQKIIRLINASSTKAVGSEALFVYQNKETFAPNEKAKITIQSAFKNAYIHQSINRNGRITNQWNTRNNNFSIKEDDRGGFHINYFTVKNNRLYKELKPINVPWTSKELNISYETFRDKIKPGSQQEWKIKISGKQKEKASAEILTTMYDASLDAFAKNNWNALKLYRNNAQKISLSSNAFGHSTTQNLFSKKYKRLDNYRSYTYPRLNMFGLEYGNSYAAYRLDGMSIVEDRVIQTSNSPRLSPVTIKASSRSRSKKAAAPAGKGNNENQRELSNLGFFDANAISADSISIEEPKETIQVRTNLSETAYFLPDLKTDANGNIIFSFTAPEALTRWNIKTLAHTKDVSTAYLEKQTITQKELMITPNHPRFMRENDKMLYSAKISNLSDQTINGTAKLILINAKTNEIITQQFSTEDNKKNITIQAGQNIETNWPLNIPQAFTDPVIIKIIAKAGKYSDGEQKVIPILLNSILVTETIPLPVRANTTRQFTFDKLLNSKESATLKHHKLTIEYTSNPAWYAVQALPYLTDYPYECAEQTFNRYYANALASHIANSSPRIKKIFSTWKSKDTAALLSNLEKNQELKSALLQETPWVLQAENETEQKKRIAHLFNIDRMSKELNHSINKLEKLQTTNGGFAWFKGMRDNRFITQYIVTGIARLQKLGVTDAKQNQKISTILNKAIPYLDNRIREDYQYIVTRGKLAQNNLSYHHIQYLYMRSFFPDKKIGGRTQIAVNYFKKKGRKHWTTYNKYMQGMLAIVNHRDNQINTTHDIMDALRQNAIHKEEMGMYWKEFNQGSYWWHSAPIEAHSLLIEAFREMPGVESSGNKLTEIDELRIWLLKQKQTQQWRTTKATADACYALLLGGADWLGSEPKVNITLGNKKINLNNYKQEAGTGYTKIKINKEEIKPSLGNISVNVKSDKKVGTTWGAVYWQYFEQLDNITESETPLSLKKQVYKIVNGPRGEELKLVKDGATLQIGDKVKVRIELRVDRRMEFVHMKDMRGACFEPTNVLSQYKYQNGLGYYESTKDASTQFFFDQLSPGTYVFEYPMFTTIKGNYSNGITTIQCMYAPEFSSHSEGVRINVK